MVSIITVNYNGLDDTCEMIDSFLLNETYPSKSSWWTMVPNPRKRKSSGNITPLIPK